MVVCFSSIYLRVARSGSGAKAPPLAERPTQDPNSNTFIQPFNHIPLVSAETRWKYAPLPTFSATASKRHIQIFFQIQYGLLTPISSFVVFPRFFEIGRLPDPKSAEIGQLESHGYPILKFSVGDIRSRQKRVN